MRMSINNTHTGTKPSPRKESKSSNFFLKTHVHKQSFQTYLDTHTFILAFLNMVCFFNFCYRNATVFPNGVVRPLSMTPEACFCVCMCLWLSKQCAILWQTSCPDRKYIPWCVFLSLGVRVCVYACVCVQTDNRVFMVSYNNGLWNATHFPFCHNSAHTGLLFSLCCLAVFFPITIRSFGIVEQLYTYVYQ